MTTLFSSQPQDDNLEDVKFEDLVGEGKQFKDPDALAKSKKHADTFISRLERENEEMRAELNKRLAVEEYLNKQSASKSGLTTDERDSDDDLKAPTLDVDTLKKSLKDELRQELESINKQSQAQKNVERVADELRKAWGDSYSQKLTARAKELDLDQDVLAQLAETKPNAFLKIVLPQATRSDLMSPVRSSQNSISEGHERNYKYYQNLKRNDPKKYFTREVQAQEHRDALRLRDKFFE